MIFLVIVVIHTMVVIVKIVRLIQIFFFISIIFSLYFIVGLGYKFYLVNYTNLTSPGIPTLIAIFNQTIINITNGSVIANSISIR